MSKESLSEFIQFMANDSEASAKIKKFGGDMEAIVRYGQKLGYDFDQTDVKEYQNKMFNVLKCRVEKKIKSEVSASESQGVEQIKQLIILGETDENVGKKLTELGLSNPQDLIAYGRELGFIFAPADMENFAKNIIEPTDELSDEELEAAAGGTTMVLMFLGIGVFVTAGVAAIAAAGAAVGAGAVLLANAVNTALKK